VTEKKGNSTCGARRNRFAGEGRKKNLTASFSLGLVIKPEASEIKRERLSVVALGGDPTDGRRGGTLSKKKVAYDARLSRRKGKKSSYPPPFSDRRERKESPGRYLG